ncbi:helix-turn-helix domain-containing protein [Treponema sp.]|uniref:helix-turn-helix domain-containing protein n=1 Tax=Treponema sp. TaxID=166 RepID=UPI003F02DDE5
MSVDIIRKMNSFRENLRSELDFQGLTVKELSAKTGIVKGTLDNYLGARASIPPADIAVKIAEALNVSVEFLVTGKERKENKNELYVFVTAEEKTILNDLGSVPQNIQKTFKSLLHQTAESIKSVKPDEPQT